MVPRPPWSVYGATEDDCPRAEAHVPDELADLMDEDDVGTIPLRMAQRLTGVDLNKESEARSSRVRLLMHPAKIELESDEEPPDIKVGDAESNEWGMVASVELDGIMDPAA